jgi:hypothetical protein
MKPELKAPKSNKPSIEEDSEVFLTVYFLLEINEKINPDGLVKKSIRSLYWLLS